VVFAVFKALWATTFAGAPFPYCLFQCILR
jgi:hypothetical protein